MSDPNEISEICIKRITEKYPDRIPVFVSKSKFSDVPDIDKKKFLVPNDMSLGLFSFIIRKRIKLKDSQAMYFFTTDGAVINMSENISELSDKHKNSSGYLELQYASENTFG